MKSIFLGRPIHWLIILALIALGWFGGLQRLHVTSFNLFAIVLIVIVVIALVVVILTSRPGETETRDPIVDE